MFLGIEPSVINPSSFYGFDFGLFFFFFEKDFGRLL